MFGWQKRTETRESLREEMSAAADRHARAVLADAMSQIDTRLAKDREDRSRVDLSTQTAIESLRFAVMDGTSPDLAPVLAQVAEMCALVAERLEADRLERQALTEAITLLARASAIPLASAPSDAPPRVIGGTVLASSDIPEVIDLVEADPVREPEETVDLRHDRDLDPPVDPPEQHRVPDAAVVAAASVAVHDAVAVHEPIEVHESPASVAYSEDRAELMDLIAAYVPQARAPEPSAPAAPTEPEDANVGREIWDTVPKDREERSSLADIDLRPRHGTRLTARRSNAPV